MNDGIVGEFGSYEDYLDSQISATDLYYLEDEDLARQLVVRPQTRLAPILKDAHTASAPLPLCRSSATEAAAKLSSERSSRHARERQSRRG